MLTYCLTGVLLLIPLLSYGQIYRWVDDDGKVHFSDRRPEQPIPAQNVELTPGNQYQGSRIYQQQQDVFKVYDGERILRQELREEEREQRAERDRKCAYARKKLNNLRDASYVFKVDQNGERVIFTQEQRRQTTEYWQQYVDKNC